MKEKRNFENETANETKKRRNGLDEGRKEVDEIFTHDFRLVRRLHFPRLDFDPVDAPEERVGADVLLALLAAAEALDRQLRQELDAESTLKLADRQSSTSTYPFANLLRLLGQRLWVGDVVVGDGGEQLLLVLAVERRLADEHFVEQHPVSPPIHALAVRLVLNNLQHNRGDA